MRLVQDPGPRWWWRLHPQLRRQEGARGVGGEGSAALQGRTLDCGGLPASEWEKALSCS